MAVAGRFLLLVLAHFAAESAAQTLQNLFREGDLMDLRVFLSARPRFREFNNSDALIWHEEGIRYHADEAERTKTVTVPLTTHLLSNGSFFAHMFFTKVGFSPDPSAAAYSKHATTSLVRNLVVYDTRRKPIGLKKLLTGEPAPWEEELRRGAADAAAAGRPADEFISYWKPALHVQLVIDTEQHSVATIPPLYGQYLSAYRQISGRRYLPLVYNNELTVMRQHWLSLNKTLHTVPLELTYRPLPLRRFQWMVGLESSFKMNEENLGITEKESEDMRGMFVNTHPYLLYTTIAVSALHLLFDMLAFKNDLSFWSSIDTMEGLSTRSLLLNEIMEFVILLYLIEEDSSWLIKITSVVTMVLGLFKIFKSISVKKRDAAKAEGGVSLTDRYDELAFKWLSPPLVLVVVGYAAYALLTSYFRSWYSWLLESLVALVYGCGFIVMYKALNTFIDDLFAFIIKMPTLHRMSCFRDDIVFAIFLYQRYIYKVDHTRLNEFGQRGEEKPGKSKSKKANKSAESLKKSQ